MALLHEQKWLHGDLHPENLIWQELQEEDFRGSRLWKLLELPFLSYFPERRQNPTFGSIYTIAPERLAGQEPTFKSELYSLGCIYYYALTGQFPHVGKNAVEVAIGHLQFEPEPIPAAYGVPPDLEAWLFCLLAKKPENRFASVAEARLALRRIFGQLAK
jgi:serine/threonine-protein kinase